MKHRPRPKISLEKQIRDLEKQTRETLLMDKSREYLDQIGFIKRRTTQEGRTLFYVEWWPSEKIYHTKYHELLFHFEKNLADDFPHRRITDDTFDEVNRKAVRFNVYYDVNPNFDRWRATEIRFAEEECGYMIEGAPRVKLVDTDEQIPIMGRIFKANNELYGNYLSNSKIVLKQCFKVFCCRTQCIFSDKDIGLVIDINATGRVSEIVSATYRGKVKIEWIRCCGRESYFLYYYFQQEAEIGKIFPGTMLDFRPYKEDELPRHNDAANEYRINFKSIKWYTEGILKNLPLSDKLGVIIVIDSDNERHVFEFSHQELKSDTRSLEENCTVLIEYTFENRSMELWLSRIYTGYIVSESITDDLLIEDEVNYRRTYIDNMSVCDNFQIQVGDRVTYQLDRGILKNVKIISPVEAVYVSEFKHFKCRDHIIKATNLKGLVQGRYNINLEWIDPHYQPKNIEPITDMNISPRNQNILYSTMVNNRKRDIVEPKILSKSHEWNPVDESVFTEPEYTLNRSSSGSIEHDRRTSSDIIENDMKLIHIQKKGDENLKSTKIPKTDYDTFKQLLAKKLAISVNEIISICRWDKTTDKHYSISDAEDLDIHIYENQSEPVVEVELRRASIAPLLSNVYNNYDQRADFLADIDQDHIPPGLHRTNSPIQLLNNDENNFGSTDYYDRILSRPPGIVFRNDFRGAIGTGAIGEPRGIILKTSILFNTY
eukprot:TRINITY_DN7561_c0_g1_i1.p1 TRINITY_DN7561_c0_g1~~TRINITY_DN7561_c0_g1_i1.p1  ORF type:complete len:715 (+),score=134.02 TRINITY_DN7561_c0_g1_i1:54-2198(+)